MQNLAGRDAKPGRPRCKRVLGVEADKLRKSKATSKGPVETNRIAIDSRAMTRIRSLRFDDEHQTLRADDRNMSDWFFSQQHGHAQQLAFDPDKKLDQNLKPMQNLPLMKAMPKQMPSRCKTLPKQMAKPDFKPPANLTMRIYTIGWRVSHTKVQHSWEDMCYKGPRCLQKRAKAVARDLQPEVT